MRRRNQCHFGGGFICRSTETFHRPQTRRSVSIHKIICILDAGKEAVFVVSSFTRGLLPLLVGRWMGGFMYRFIARSFEGLKVDVLYTSYSGCC